MNSKVFNLALMAFWLLILLGLLTRDWWAGPELNDKLSGPQTPMVIMVAGVLAMWNFMRFFIAHKFSGPPAQSAEVEAYRRKIRGITGEDPKVVNPEFVFDDPPPDDPPRPAQP